MGPQMWHLCTCTYSNSFTVSNRSSHQFQTHEWCLFHDQTAESVRECWLQLFTSFLLHAHGGRVIHSGPEPRLFLFGPWHLQWPCLIPWVALEIPITNGLLGVAAPGPITAFFTLCWLGAVQLTRAVCPISTKLLSAQNCRANLFQVISAALTYT